MSTEPDDPDPWCEEADGQYEPPDQPEITSTAAEDYAPDRWNG